MKARWSTHRLLIGISLIALALFFEKDWVESELEYLSTHSWDSESVTTTIIIYTIFNLIIFIAGIIVVWKGSPIYQQKKIDEEEKNRLIINEMTQKREIEERKKIEKYNDEIRKQEEKYGTPDKRIELGYYDVNSHIVVWGEKKIMCIKGKMYSFSDILDCGLVDDVTVQKGDVEYKSEVRDRRWNESYSAEKIIETTVYQDNDYTIHNICVYINVNDFTNPTIKIYMGSDMETAKDIVNIMNIAKSRA